VSLNSRRVAGMLDALSKAGAHATRITWQGPVRLLALPERRLSALGTPLETWASRRNSPGPAARIAVVYEPTPAVRRLCTYDIGTVVPRPFLRR
jgi:hypothetical protein